MLVEMVRSVIGGAVGLLTGAICVIVLSQIMLVVNAISTVNSGGPIVAPQSQMNGLIDLYINLAGPDPFAPWKIIMELLFIIGGVLEANGIGVVNYGMRRNR
jgi:hypothetical protein